MFKFKSNDTGRIITFHRNHLIPIAIVKEGKMDDFQNEQSLLNDVVENKQQGAHREAKEVDDSTEDAGGYILDTKTRTHDNAHEPLLDHTRIALNVQLEMMRRLKKESWIIQLIV